MAVRVGDSTGMPDSPYFVENPPKAQAFVAGTKKGSRAPLCVEKERFGLFLADGRNRATVDGVLHAVGVGIRGFDHGLFLAVNHGEDFRAKLDTGFAADAFIVIENNSHVSSRLGLTFTLSHTGFEPSPQAGTYFAGLPRHKCLAWIWLSA